MPLYRKKPVLVEAVQFTDESNLPPGVYEGFWGSVENGETEIKKSGIFFVETIHKQKTRVLIGDWIVKEPDGKHYYPVKPDIFEAIYEPVESIPVVNKEVVS